MNMNKFWNWAKDSDETRVLFLDGPIDDEAWWGDEVTPKMFKDELNSGKGTVTVHINSPGGNCIAASEIYTMLMDYPYDVNVQIDGIAASAASVVAMAGTHVAMTPTGLMMIHNPSTIAMGDAKDMEKAISMLDEVKESIINAYEIKTSLPRKQIAKMMNDETWMNAKKALELGFCDEVLYTSAEVNDSAGFTFSNGVMTGIILNQMKTKEPEPETHENRVDATEREKRLMQKRYL